MGLRDALLEVLAPTRCAGCDMPGALLCADCRRNMPLVDPAYACPKCGAPFGHLTCTECWEREYAFAAAVAVGQLDRPLSRAITVYKDAGEQRLSTVLGELLAAALQARACDVGCMVPVPSSRKALMRRGFDHIGLVAEQAAASLDLPLVRALVSARAIDQRGLARDERRSNAARSLALAPDLAVPERILLVDDVFTTGATLDAASSLLLSAGANEVCVGVLARAW